MILLRLTIVKLKKKTLTKRDVVLIGKNTSINTNKIKNIKF